jgi:hypothetical protein
MQMLSTKFVVCYLHFPFPLQDEDVGPLDDSVPVHYYPEGEAAEAASAAVAIGSSNKGFQLLQKMGWKGKGLGRKEDGEPTAT